MQGMVPLSGFGGVPYSAVRKAAPRNILDNSDFTNLVAQAGIGGNHGSIAYAADRWILDSGTVSYEAGVGLTLNGTIRQKLEIPPTGETSAFVGMASGAASISYADGAVTITSSGGVLKWAALYGGVYSAATMPDYQPKDYGAELAGCQRYYVKINQSSVGYGHISNASKSIYATFPIPESLRINPTITLSGSIVIRHYNGYSSDASWGSPASNVTTQIDSNSAGSISIRFDKNDGTAWSVVTNNTIVCIQLYTNSFIELSADL